MFVFTFHVYKSCNFSSVTTTEISHDALCPNQQQISACSSVMMMFCPAHCIRRYVVSRLVFNSVALSPGYSSNACFYFLIIKYVLIGCFVSLFFALHISFQH